MGASAESVLIEVAQVDIAAVVLIDIVLAAVVLIDTASVVVEYTEAVLELLEWLGFLERQGCLEQENFLVRLEYFLVRQE